MFWLRKLLSPTGVALILICLAFPFIGVACGPVEAEISGWDMVLGGEPSYSPPNLAPDEEPDGGTGTDHLPAQPLMVAFVLALMATAVLGAALPVPLAAAVSGLVAAAFAAATLVVNEIVTMDRMVDALAEDSSGFSRRDAAGMVGTRFGFWITLLLTVALLGWFAVDLVLSRRRRPTAPPRHPPGYPYPQGNLADPYHPGQYSPGHPWSPPWAATPPLRHPPTDEA